MKKTKPEVKRNRYGERLRVDGWRYFNSIEREVFYRIPDKMIFIAETAFRVGYFEAEHLGIETNDIEFKDMCDRHRKAAMESALEQMNALPGGVEYKLTRKSDSQIKKAIRDFYKNEDTSFNRKD